MKKDIDMDGVVEKLGIDDERKETAEKFIKALLPIVYEVSPEESEKIIQKIQETITQLTQTENISNETEKTNLKNIPEIYMKSLVKEKTSNNVENKDMQEATPLLDDTDKKPKIEKPIQIGTIKGKTYILKKVELNKNSEDIREYLLSQYSGHCQICNTKLDLGNGKVYFEIFRIVESRGSRTWTDSKFNVLSLCPNCHALLKHGGGDLTGIIEMVKKIKNREYTAENVPGRPANQGYEIDITIAGKKKSIFFTKDHMANIISLLPSDKQE